MDDEKSSVTCQVSVYSQIDNSWMLFQHEINAGNFTTFCHCWRLAGDNIEFAGVSNNSNMI